MKNLFTLSSLFAVIFLFLSCSSDDNETTIPADKQKLTLTADHETTTIGTTVKFTVKLNDQIITDALVKQKDGETLTSGEWKPEAAGTFTFVAQKQGFENSNEISIVVTKEKTQLILTANKTTVENGEEVLFTVTAEEEGISDFTLEILNKEKINSNKWIPTEEGTFQVIASKEGFIDSTPLEIIVTEKVDAEAKGEGSFTYIGATYTINCSKLILQGISSSSNPTATWILQSKDLEKNISVYTFFATPAAEGKDGNYTFEMPTTKNISRLMLTVIDETTQSVIDLAVMGIEVEAQFGAINVNNIVPGNIKIAIEDLGGEPFELNYKGTHNYERTVHE
ncbi:hypothetical protein [Myroides sp. LoEW2-1]|uniref:hypothetical protein n=1 Tax=Myroides sp. LoEW2-1 TaxID=2683192 RepID=UPI001320AB1C|nr:hypothetical protein [Myroides sp. LoEW2-1]MVX34806.1 hypothetical protein [Myroides sp. LoEW2-1]